MPNRFQSLIEEGRPSYTREERLKKAITVDHAYLDGVIVPAVVKGAREHVSARYTAVCKRVADGSCGFTYETTELAHIVEALFDPHFRKQRRNGPTKATVQEKVKAALATRRPLELIGLMFTRKNICPLKRADGDESTVDLAEILSCAHIDSFCALIEHFYPYGVTFHILSEGKRFITAFHLCEPAVLVYQNRLRQWITAMGLMHIDLQDYEDYMNAHLTPDQKTRRIISCEQTRQEYEESIVPLLDMNDMRTSIERVIEADFVKDPYNPRNTFIPLWDSIKNSLPYPELQEHARTIGVEYDRFYAHFFSGILDVKTDRVEEELRKIVLKRSWDAAVTHNTSMVGDRRVGDIDAERLLGPHTLRATINPKPGSAYLGIYSVRETTHRVQPWHGMAYLRGAADGRAIHTVLSRIEIEGHGAVPVYVKGPDPLCLCYVDSTIAKTFSAHGEFQMNMSTRV